MINLIANEKFKKLGCKWDGVMWVSGKLAQEEYNTIKKTFYEDMIAIEVTLNEGQSLEWQDWAYKNVRLIGGYIVAMAKGRDSGAILCDIAVLEGSFRSGGSVKNFMCNHSDELILRMEVSRNALSFLDEEVNEGIYTYKILNDNIKSLNDLQEEKRMLIEKLSEIEEEINQLTVN